ncbi:MAG: polysaccharide deacetylase family protein [Pseudolabrys sp.]|nr:polysaccharide deacetylase family protein [Pseudolabrys sp.]MCW5685678.1 polysaccharide deacetylase family protein [Pseudolabrys sp.]
MADLTLTFDNGPDPETTPLVLDVLARRGIRATFFVVGERLAAPGGHALAAAAHAAGHWIGNHTWTHSGPLGTRDGVALADQEIGRTQAEIGALAHPHRLFRPQGGGGALGPHLFRSRDVAFLKAQRMSCVLWNAIPGDWKDPDGWVDRALAQIDAQSWTLMVLHDLPTGAMRRLDAFLDQVAARHVRLRQDFPPDCMPLVDGVVVRPINDCVTDAPKE